MPRVTASIGANHLVGVGLASAVSLVLVTLWPSRHLATSSIARSGIVANEPTLGCEHYDCGPRQIIQNPGAFHDGLARALNEDGAIGYVDRDYHWVIPPKFKAAGDFFEGRASVKPLGEVALYGVVDRLGHFVVPPTYHDITDYRRSAAVARLEQGWSYANRQGEVVLHGRWSDARRFHEGRAAVRGANGKWTFIRSDGTYIHESQFDWVGDFSGGIAAVGCEGNEWGYIDRSGTWLLPCGHGVTCEDSLSFQSVDRESLEIGDSAEDSASRDACTIEAFRRGDSRTKRVLSSVLPYVRRRAGALATLLSRYSGEQLNQLFPGIHPPMEDLLVVDDGESYGVIETRGKLVIPMRFAGIGRFSQGLVSFREAVEGGTCPSPIGFMNRQGRTVVPPRYTQAGHFEEGLAPACIGGRATGEPCDPVPYWPICGYIDEGGSEVYPPNFSTRISPYFVEWQEDSFSYVGNFHRGLAPAAKTGAAVGYIDMTGAWAIEPRFRNAREFSDENLAPVALSAEYVLLDREGNIVANGDHLRVRLDGDP